MMRLPLSHWIPSSFVGEGGAGGHVVEGEGAGRESVILVEWLQVAPVINFGS